MGAGPCPCLDLSNCYVSLSAEAPVHLGDPLVVPLPSILDSSLAMAGVVVSSLPVNRTDRPSGQWITGQPNKRWGTFPFSCPTMLKEAVIRWSGGLSCLEPAENHSHKSHSISSPQHLPVQTSHPQRVRSPHPVVTEPECFCPVSFQSPTPYPLFSPAAQIAGDSIIRGTAVSVAFTPNLH